MVVLFDKEGKPSHQKRIDNVNTIKLEDGNQALICNDDYGNLHRIALVLKPEIAEQLRGAVSLEAVRHGIDEIERVQYLHGTRCGDFKAALDAVRASLDLLGGQ